LQSFGGKDNLGLVQRRVQPGSHRPGPDPPMLTSEESLAIKLIAVTAATIYLVRWFRQWLQRSPVASDPWEGKIRPEEVDAATPVCLNCLTPVAPHQHYCPVCNNVTGEFTRYLPFVNIPFNYSIFQTLWRKLRSPDTTNGTWLLAFIVILLLAPIMLIIGGPLWVLGRKKGDAEGLNSTNRPEPP
jgi:hypothetical protein